MINKIKYIGVFLLLLSVVISCEKDFEKVGSSIISNTKFSTDYAVFKTVVTNKEVPFVRADGLGEYLLGVYNNTKNTGYKKIEASIVSQIKSTKEVSKLEVPKDYKIDGGFLVIPYQATSIRTPSGKKPKFKLDSIIGDATKGFSVKVYQNNTYLNRLNPTNPNKNNVFNSNKIYEKTRGILNKDPNYLLKPNANDTVYYFNRYSGKKITIKDSLKMKGKPFVVIPLDKKKINTLFLDKYKSSDFTTEQAFQNYFRGLIIEVTGNEGSLIPFNFTKTDLIPSLKICYTNVVTTPKTDGTEEIKKYVPKKDSYPLLGITNSIYKMTTVNKPATKDVVVQGTAGNIAEIKLFEGTDLDKLRAKNWLINDASLTFYVDQNIIQDITTIPRRLFLCKTIIDKKTGKIIPIQLKDLIIERANTFGGKLEMVNKKPEKYTFKITNYISDLLKSKGNPPLLLRVFNPSDVPTNPKDIIVKTYNWNPRMVTLLNHLEINGNKKVQLKISYSVKK